MNNLREIVEKYDLGAYKYQYIGKTRVIDTKNGKYIIKKKTNDKKDIYDYLDSRGFSNYLKLENSYDEAYEIYRYIDNREINDEDKAIDLVYILSMLHIKTTTYRAVVLDDVKNIYEQINNNINYLLLYYRDLQDYIESKVYMSPGEYLLIRNISAFYNVLELSKNSINKWYDVKKNMKKERVVLLHNNLELNHFLEGEEKVLINWDRAYKDYVVYDFLDFYRNEYLNIEMNSLYEIYQSKYRYTYDEKLLFFSLLFLPWKVEFNDTNYNNTVKINKLVRYIYKTMEFISKENEKYEEANKEKLK